MNLVHNGAQQLLSDIFLLKGLINIFMGNMTHKSKPSRSIFHMKSGISHQFFAFSDFVHSNCTTLCALSVNVITNYKTVEGDIALGPL